MEASASQEQLKRIAQYLQEQLKPQAQITPLQVQCALKAGLMVLVQHPPGTAPDPQWLFHALEQGLGKLPKPLFESLPSEAQALKVQLFLRVLGQQKPYAFHDTKLASGTGTIADSLKSKPDPIEQSANFAPSPASGIPIEDREEPAQASHELEEAGQLIHAPNSHDLALKAQAEITPFQKPTPLKTGRSLTQPLLWAGGGVAAIAVLSLGGYALSRPCVVGGCASLQTAQQLSQQSTQAFKTANSEPAFQQAKQELTQAHQLVSEIPAWSSHYGEAQPLKQGLDQVLAAETKAEAATQKGQSAAQAVTDWQITQSLWRDGIAQLEAIPADSPLHAVAQERLAAYRANLGFTTQRISAERDAQTRIASAKKTSELAIARQNTAQQLPDWQLAQATWQMAVNSLQQIPSGTTSHAEAQQLLERYRVKLAETRDRTTKEQAAKKAYMQAMNLEKQAKAWQQKNQWSQATASWRNALTYAKQIPAGTSLEGQGQALVTAYTSTLKQAETVVKVRGDMDKICFAAGKICDYTIQNDLIRVQFVPAYERKVRTLGGLSWYSRDYDSMYQINKHFATMGDALQAVSTNYGIPIEVYNSDNQVIAGFAPGR